MSDHKPTEERLVELATAGDASSAAELFHRHRDRLKRMVSSRMDRRLAARFDPSDVVQEAWITASSRLPEFGANRAVPFYVWLRKITFEHLLKLHRYHFQTKKRTVEREFLGSGLRVTDESMGQLADRFVDSLTGPHERVMRKEMRERVRAAIRELNEIDREIIELRYLELLTNEEIAVILEVTTSVVHSRHFRAIQRLTDHLHADG